MNCVDKVTGVAAVDNNHALTGGLHIRPHTMPVQHNTNDVIKFSCLFTAKAGRHYHDNAFFRRRFSAVDATVMHFVVDDGR